jgi:cysteine synthase
MGLIYKLNMNMPNTMGVTVLLELPKISFKAGGVRPAELTPYSKAEFFNLAGSVKDRTKNLHGFHCLLKLGIPV